MKWTFLKWIGGMVVVLVVAVLSVAVNGQKKHISTLKMQVKEQSAVIDSLLSRRMTVFDVQLNVTDKSTNKINGKFNKGDIVMPQQKIYELKFDSVSWGIK